MQFIVSTNADKADATTRRLIRSQARRVQNKRQLKRSRENSQQQSQLGKLPIDQSQRTSLLEVLDMYTPLPAIPPRVGADLSFIHFADEIEDAVALNMVKAAPMARKIIFPLISAIGVPADDVHRLCPLQTDAAALHVTAFAMEALVDRYLRHEHDQYTNAAASLHLHKGLQILRDRFCGGMNDNQISDSTMSVVTKLASSAHLDGDSIVSQQHIRGLRTMVDLRGGFKDVHNVSLTHEMLRNDIAIALLNESKPAFYTTQADLFRDYAHVVYLNPGHTKPSIPEDAAILRQIDHRLTEIWLRMRYFCVLVNLSLQTGRRIRFGMIHDTMMVVMYPLFYMTDFASSSLDETIRIGLLTFAYHVFVQWQEIKPISYSLLGSYKSRILSEVMLNHLPPHISLWLSMVAALSLYDVGSEPWLQKTIGDLTSKLCLRNWKDMQATLKSVLWISLLDEQPGRDVYQMINN